jgi:aspartyl protease
MNITGGANKGTERKIAGLLLLSSLVAVPKPALAGKCGSNLDVCGTTLPGQRIPLRIYRNFLIVAEGKIAGGPEERNFILDTGTAPSIISVKLVSRLGLATRPSTVTVLGKALPIQEAVVPEIEIGPVRAISFPVQVQDLSRLEGTFGMPIDGIIGLDLLSKSSFHINYDRKEIEFGEISREGIPVPYDPRAGLAVAGLKIGGRPVRMLVDTGSDRVVLLGGNFAEVGWMGLRDTAQRGTTLADQELHVRKFSAPEIIFGGERFRNDQAYFVPGTADPEFDGLLGVRALGFRGVSFDRASATVYLQK